MDLTPSPASSQQNFATSPRRESEIYCSPDPVAAAYPSPNLMDFPLKPSSSYGIMGPSSAQNLHADVSRQPLEALGRASWTATPDSVSVASPPSSAGTPHMITPSDYVSSFGSYESCLPSNYTVSESYTLGAASPTLPRSPPLSTGGPARTPTPVTFSRSPFSYSQDAAVPRLKMEVPGHYSPSLEPTGITMRAMSHPYTANSGPFSPRYVEDGTMSSWTNPDMSASQYYSTSPTRVQCMDNQDRRTSATFRARRQPRKHTTREEANFQCQVKGCGKFFSRSYNFKSHMETHDQNREYPFPCGINDCTKRFVRRTDLQRHHQSVHMKERNHKCDFCDRLFARKDTLRRHMEDGCSKRFDIETLDIRAEGFGSTAAINRPVRTNFGPAPLTFAHATSPAMTVGSPAIVSLGDWQR